MGKWKPPLLDCLFLWIPTMIAVLGLYIGIVGILQSSGSPPPDDLTQKLDRLFLVAFVLCILYGIVCFAIAFRRTSKVNTMHAIADLIGEGHLLIQRINSVEPGNETQRNGARHDLGIWEEKTKTCIDQFDAHYSLMIEDRSQWVVPLHGYGGRNDIADMLNSAGARMQNLQKLLSIISAQ